MESLVKTNGFQPFSFTSSYQFSFLCKKRHSESFLSPLIENKSERKHTYTNFRKLCLSHTNEESGTCKSEIVPADKVKEIEAINEITALDEKYMELALSTAEIGFGQTYPNPAVGCILVRKVKGEPDEIIGKGFHPKSGMPHAEVFALFEASGLVDDGVAAARSVLPERTFGRRKFSDDESQQLANQVESLLSQYTSENGAHNLFHNCCNHDELDNIEENGTTAYVTLEPCCHTGRTPPCATSFVIAGVSRVVVGFRDPNPRVDGGGVKLLRDSGVRVDYFTANESQNKEDKNDEDVQASETSLGDNNKCAEIVENFVKRITAPPIDYESIMNGKKRRYLRSLANTLKSNGDMTEVVLSKALQRSDPRWMEELDAKLWKHELVVIKMKNALDTKKECSLLGEEIANELNAHVAQVLGRTVLLYRPGVPRIIDLDAIKRENYSSEIDVAT